jgi:hypothetical protein
MCEGVGLFVLSGGVASPQFHVNVVGFPSDVLVKLVVSFAQTATDVKFAVGTGFTVITPVVVSPQPLPEATIKVVVNVPALE